MTFDLSQCIGFVTDTAIKRISEDFNRRLEKKGSTRIQWVALYFLSKAEKPMRQKELAILMNIQDPTLARLVDRLERNNLISRIGNKADKRVKFLELTKMGQEKVSSLIPVGEHFSNLLLEDVSKQELDTFEVVLSKMLCNIKK